MCVYLKTFINICSSVAEIAASQMLLGNVYLTSQAYSAADLCKRMELSIKKGMPLKPSRNY